MTFLQQDKGTKIICESEAILLKQKEMVYIYIYMTKAKIEQLKSILESAEQTGN